MRGVRGEVRLREGEIEGGVMVNGEEGGGEVRDRRVVRLGMGHRMQQLEVQEEVRNLRPRS